MTLETFTEWLRLANAGLALVALVAFGMRLNYRWEILDQRLRWVWLAVAGLLFAIAYGSVESYYLASPIGLRSYFINFFLTALLIALWRLRRTPA